MHTNGYNENNSNETTHGNANIKITLGDDPNEITRKCCLSMQTNKDILEKLTYFIKTFNCIERY